MGSVSKLLFSEIALKKNLVTNDQIDECLEIQRKLTDMGIEKSLGAVMVDKKYLSKMEVKQILSDMTTSQQWHSVDGYEILGKLGTGGMGSVYKARDRRGHLIALKILTPEQASNREFLSRFLREARSAAKLNHPNMVKALDVGESHGHHYFAMEYVDGLTIKDMITGGKPPLTEGEAARIIVQVAAALEHANKYNMIHRDIKPSNILVTHSGVAKLCDLGLAKELDDKTNLEVTKVTKTGVVMGTPYYLSPEQARSEKLDIRSDLYSLGITFYHMVTGEVPYAGNSAATILYKHIFQDPPDVRAKCPAVSDAMAEIIKTMMAKRPDDRYQTPRELLDALAELGFTPHLPAGTDLSAMDTISAFGDEEDVLDEVVQLMLADQDGPLVATTSDKWSSNGLPAPLLGGDSVTSAISLSPEDVPVPSDPESDTATQVDLPDDWMGLEEGEEEYDGPPEPEHGAEHSGIRPRSYGGADPDETYNVPDFGALAGFSLDDGPSLRDGAPANDRREPAASRRKRKPSAGASAAVRDLPRETPEQMRVRRHRRRAAQALARKLFLVALLCGVGAVVLGLMFHSKMPRPGTPLQAKPKAPLATPLGSAGFDWNALQGEVEALLGEARYGAAFALLVEQEQVEGLSAAGRLVIEHEKDRVVREALAAARTLEESAAAAGKDPAAELQRMGLPRILHYLDTVTAAPDEGPGPASGTD